MAAQTPQTGDGEQGNTPLTPSPAPDPGPRSSAPDKPRSTARVARPPAPPAAPAASAVPERPARSAAPVSEGDLEPDFPRRDELIAAGLKTKDQVRHCGDLTAIQGITHRDVTPIRRAAGYPGSQNAR